MLRQRLSRARRERQADRAIAQSSRAPPLRGGQRHLRSYSAKKRVSRLATVLTTTPLRHWGPLEWFGLSLAVAAGLVALLVLEIDAGLDGPLWLIAVLGLMAGLAERQPVRVTSNLEMTVSVLPVLFAAVAFGPLEAMAVATIGLLADLKRPYLRWLIWTSHSVIAAALAGLIAQFVLLQSESFGAVVVAVALAAFTEAVVDVTVGSLTVSFRGSGSCQAFLRSMRPVLLGTVPLYTPVIVLLVYAYELSPSSLILFLGPAFAAHHLYGLYHQERQAREQLANANRRLEEAHLSFAGALAAALDARDKYTAGHSAAVAVYARDIAERLGLTAEEQQLAHLAGLLHDIGKVGVPIGILEKEGPLTLEERRHMEEHSEIGERILAHVPDYSEIANIVRHHHERMDGNGYPDSLAGEEIPLISRIVGVADAYNAMTSGRPYRDAMPTQVARLRLAQAVETQFDITVVAAFEAILASAGETYRSGARADFALEAQQHPELASQLSAGAA